MSAAATPGPPDLSGLKDDWNRMSGLRRAEHSEEPPDRPAPEQPAAPPAPTKKRTPTAAVPSGQEPTMSRRSWYAEQEAVEALAEVVDDIHYATRKPKHQVVSELFRAAVAAAPRVQKKLSK